MSKVKITLGDRIKELRNGINLSQVELTNRIKISKAQYSRYENQNVQPPADVLNKLADVLGTTVDFLLNGNSGEKAKASLKNAELLNKFKELEALPDKEQNMIIQVVNALIRDYKAKQAYAL